MEKCTNFRRRKMSSSTNKPINNIIIIKDIITCDCSDCGGKRVKGPCLIESNQTLQSVQKVTFL